MNINLNPLKMSIKIQTSEISWFPGRQAAKMINELWTETELFDLIEKHYTTSIIDDLKSGRNKERFKEFKCYDDYNCCFLWVSNYFTRELYEKYLNDLRKDAEEFYKWQHDELILSGEMPPFAKV